MRSVSAEAEKGTAFERVGGGRVIAPAGAGGGDQAAGAVVEMVARQRSIPVARLFHRSRCTADVAEARMLAMYLVHVVLSRSYSEVGQFFRRDRTTVAHACARIEDMRDRQAFDAEVAGLESEIGGIHSTETCHAAG